MTHKFQIPLLFVFVLLIASAFCADDDTQDDWLHVNENAEIVDKNGNPVWLTGCNWFGFNTGSGVFDGVWSGNLRVMLSGIADHGFNLLRVPVSTEILLQWKNGDPDPKKPQVNDYVNPELAGMSSYELFIQTLKWCKEFGIKIMVDIHSAETHAAGHLFNLWYHGDFTSDDWLDSLEWLAENFKNDDTILAIDLKNEPHGKSDDGANAAIWDDSTSLNNWKYAAEQGAGRILAQNPNLLIMVEGVEVYPKEGYTWTSPSKDWGTGVEYFYGGWWGGNLRGVKEHPVNLGKYQSQLVYSPHDYGPLVYDQAWFHDGFTQKSIMEEYWHDAWFYIVEEKIAPLLMGEWGGFMDGGKNEAWMEMLRDLMIENRIHHTFWCYNANSGDTGGLVGYDFTTWEEDKYNLVLPALWKTDEGKFIGLDHKVALGKNGISLSQYYS